MEQKHYSKINVYVRVCLCVCLRELLVIPVTLAQIISDFNL